MEVSNLDKVTGRLRDLSIHLLRNEGVAQMAAEKARSLRLAIFQELKNQFVEKGLTRAQVIERSGVTDRTFSNIDHGLTTPSDWTLMKLFAVLGIIYPGIPNLTGAYPISEWYFSETKVLKEGIEKFPQPL